MNRGSVVPPEDKPNRVRAKRVDLILAQVIPLATAFALGKCSRFL
jgi:hypothetical protein